MGAAKNMKNGNQINVVDGKYNCALGVITHVDHWLNQNGEPICYEPYAREIRIWADLFSKVDVLAPRGEGAPRGALAAYEKANISWIPVEYANAVGWKYTLTRAYQLPRLTINIAKFILAHDFVQPRSPGHPAFVGNVIARLFRKPSITKYAGYFGYFPGERLTSISERVFLSMPTQTNRVLVYGKAKRKHFVSFIPALMSEAEINMAESISQNKKWDTEKIHIVSVGRLSPYKDFDLAINGLGELYRIRPDLSWDYTLVGGGELRKDLEELCEKNKIRDRVTFTSALPFNQVQEIYANAHFVIMPGTREGWPKTIAEAWAHFCIPIVAASLLSLDIINNSENGFLFNPDPKSLAVLLANILQRERDELKFVSQKAHNNVHALSMERFRDRLTDIIEDLQKNMGYSIVV
jgi:glycosyltransferase involved in cell wall biosynthesis